MGLFRKKMKLNEIYKGIIMDMVQPEAQTWVVEILFPDFKSTAMRNRPKDAMGEKNFDKRDLESIRFYTRTCVWSCWSCDGHKRMGKER